MISTDYYYVTLPIHPHAEVTMVTKYLRQSVRSDVLGQRFSNYHPRPNPAREDVLSIIKKIYTKNLLIW